MILLLDCDIPWIPSRNPPPKDARIYHIDIDPLNQQIPVSFFPAHGRWKADSFTALTQLVKYIKSDSSLLEKVRESKYIARGKEQSQKHRSRLAQIHGQINADPVMPLNAHNIGSLLRKVLPSETDFVV